MIALKLLSIGSLAIPSFIIQLQCYYFFRASIIAIMPNSETPSQSDQNTLIDPFGRHISYVRLSVTDRCDFRCVYCMAENMTFINRREILTLEEIELIAQAFVEMGVTKIRLTGGEPLVRKGVLDLVNNIGRLKHSGLEELLLTSNGSQLPKMAQELKAAGLSRINISLDSLNTDRFKKITRTGNLEQVIQGIDATIAAGFTNTKINSVILKGQNDDEILDLVNFACEKEINITFIEEMPLGDITSHGRSNTYCSSDEVRDTITQKFSLDKISAKTGGPSNYYQIKGRKSRVGFISPHSHNFCGDCNRVRVTVEGKLLFCLGNNHSIDLKPILRQYPGEIDPIKDAIRNSLHLKPEKHEFDINDDPQIVRFMNMTGG